MFDWLKRRAQLSGLRAATEDVERFHASLRGMSDPEIGMLLALATAIRLNLRNENVDIASLLSGDGLSPSEAELDALVRLPRLIKECQREGQMSDAAALMVWYHSLRIAALYPELRIKGREVWVELCRGFDFAEDAVDDLEFMIGKKLPVNVSEEYRFVPYAFSHPGS